MQSLSFWSMIVDLIQSVIVEVVAYLNNLVFSFVSFDFTSASNYLVKTFPFLNSLTSFSKHLALIFVIGISIVSLYRILLNQFTEAEMPSKVIFKIVISGILIYTIHLILVNVVFQPLQMMIEYLSNENTGITVTFQDLLKKWTSTAGILDTLFGNRIQQLANSLITLLLTITIGGLYFKLVLQFVERWVQIYVLYMTAPIAVAMNVSETTKSIFQSYLRMFFATAFLCVVNGLFLVIFTSALADHATSAESINITNAAIDPEWVWSIAMIAVLHVGAKMESIISSMGVNVAQCGAGLMGDIAGSLMSLYGAKRLLGGVGGSLKKAGSAIKEKATFYRDHSTNTTTEGTKMANERVSSAMPNLTSSGVVSTNAEKSGDATIRNDGKAVSWTMNGTETGSVDYTMYQTADAAKEAAKLDGNDTNDYYPVDVEGIDGKKSYVYAVAGDVPYISDADTLRSEFGDGKYNTFVKDNAEMTNIETDARACTRVSYNDASVKELYSTSINRNNANYPEIQTESGQRYIERNCFDVEHFRVNTTTERIDRVKELSYQTGDKVKSYSITNNGMSACLQYTTQSGAVKNITNKADYQGKSLPTSIGETNNKMAYISEGPVRMQEKTKKTRPMIQNFGVVKQYRNEVRQANMYYGQQVMDSADTATTSGSYEAASNATETKNETANA